MKGKQYAKSAGMLLYVCSVYSKAMSDSACITQSNIYLGLIWKANDFKLVRHEPLPDEWNQKLCISGWIS